MIRVFTAFSGYDSQCMALDRLGIEYELVGWSEIDKYAIQAHNAVYPNWANRNYGDISKIDWANVPDFDLFTYSFPCTDISSAGQKKGLQEGSGTRSSLLWECRKAIEEKKPKYLLMENVKALITEKFMPFIMQWERWLTEQGYSNFTNVLNAKDFGVPQNRERVFMVSILGEQTYHFPKPFELKLRLKDVLEQNVDDYYLLHPSNKWIISKNASKTIDMGMAAIDPEIAICITARGFISWNCTYVTREDGKISILTNKEVFRLMGVSEADIDKIQKSGVSKTQQYKMAGNSIVVDVLYHIFRKLFVEKENENEQLTLF